MGKIRLEDQRLCFCFLKIAFKECFVILNSTLPHSKLFNNKIPSFIQHCPHSVWALLWAGDEGQAAAEHRQRNPHSRTSILAEDTAPLQHTHTLMTVQTEAHRDTQPLSVSCQVCPALCYAGPPSVCSHMADSSSNSGTTPCPNPDRSRSFIHKGLEPSEYTVEADPGPRAPKSWEEGEAPGHSQRNTQEPCSRVHTQRKQHRKGGGGTDGKVLGQPRGINTAACWRKRVETNARKGQLGTGTEVGSRAWHREDSQYCLNGGQNQHDARHPWGQKKAGSHQHEDDKG